MSTITKPCSSKTVYSITKNNDDLENVTAVLNKFKYSPKINFYRFRVLGDRSTMYIRVTLY